MIRAVAARLPGDWTVDLVGDVSLSAVLVPNDSDRFSPSFLLEATPSGFMVTGHRWDIAGTVVDYAGILDALNEVVLIVKAVGHRGSTRLH